MGRRKFRCSPSTRLKSRGRVIEYLAIIAFLSMGIMNESKSSAIRINCVYIAMPSPLFTFEIEK